MKNRPYIIPLIIAAIMLLLALADWPYGYYRLLRLVVFGAGGYIAYIAYELKKMWAVWLFGFKDYVVQSVNYDPQLLKKFFSDTEKKSI